MKNLTTISRGAIGSMVALALILSAVHSASAQTPGVPNSTMTVTGNGNGTTPVFYQNGTAVNPSGSAVPAGNYTNAQGQQVYYYGNGTYYNSATSQYGGQAFGTTPGSIAAVNTVSPTVVAVTASGTPLAPNTGAGGDALYSILGIVAALAVAGTSATYLARKPVAR